MTADRWSAWLHATAAVGFLLALLAGLFSTTVVAVACAVLGAAALASASLRTLLLAPGRAQRKR